MANREPGPSKLRTDWSKCCEDLKSPSEQQTHENGAYTMVVVHIPLFYIICEMTIVLDPARLHDGNVIQEILW